MLEHIRHEQVASALDNVRVAGCVNNVGVQAAGNDLADPKMNPVGAILGTPLENRMIDIIWRINPGLDCEPGAFANIQCSRGGNLHVIARTIKAEGLPDFPVGECYAS